MDYEKLYNELKEEYELNKSDTDEIMKEYESTIKLLTDTTEVFKKENETLKKQNEELLVKQKQFVKDIESYKNKNLDKMKDIEILNNKNEQLLKEITTLTQHKALFDTKIVTLENDNDHFLSKIRENESRIEDLNMKLESALEENISLQTDFETYKQMAEEQILRKEQELKDAQNEILNKEKIVAKLTMKETINQIGKQLYGNKNNMHVPNVLSHLTFHSDMSHSNKSNIHSNNINNSKNDNNSVNNNNNENNNKVSTLDRNSRNNRTWSTKDLMNAILNHSQMNNSNNNNNNIEQGKDTKDSFTRKRSVSTKDKKNNDNNNKNSINQNKVKQISILNKEEDIKDDQVVISEAEADDDESGDNSLKSVNINENEEHKQFDNIEIDINNIELTFIGKIPQKTNSNNKNTTTNTNNNTNKDNNNSSKRTDISDNQLTENLKEMLVRIQKRKSELLTYRKTIGEKLEKIGVKIL